MRDSIIKNTGNSRYLKSAISAATTWEQFRAALIAGTLPIDLNGINTAGWQQVGDALNKANLLPDTVATLLELTQGNPQVKDALEALAHRAKIATGSYTGTGTYGASNPCSLTFPFSPELVIVRHMVLMRGAGDTFHSTSSNGSSSGNAKNTAIWTETGVEWYCSQSYQPSASAQMNAGGEVYHYLAIG